MTSKFSPLAAVAMAMGSLAAGLIVPTVMSATSASAASTLCSKVSMAKVSSTLGVKVTKLTTVVHGNVTVCWYKVGANRDAIFVRSQTRVNIGVFNLNRLSAKRHGEKPVTDKHFSPYSAYSTSLGSPTYGYTFSVAILKKSTELDVGAANSKLPKVEALAKKVLPLL